MKKMLVIAGAFFDGWVLEGCLVDVTKFFGTIGYNEAGKRTGFMTDVLGTATLSRIVITKNEFRFRKEYTLPPCTPKVKWSEIDFKFTRQGDHWVGTYHGKKYERVYTGLDSVVVGRGTFSGKAKCSLFEAPDGLFEKEEGSQDGQG